MSEEEGEYKKEKTKRGKFVAVKEEKDSSEVVVEVRVHWSALVSPAEDICQVFIIFELIWALCLQLTDSAGEEELAELKKAQKGEKWTHELFSSI